MDPSYDIHQNRNNQDTSKDPTRLKAKGSVLFASKNISSFLPPALTNATWESEETYVENEKENDNIREKKGKSIDVDGTNSKYEPIERQHKVEVQGEDEWEDEDGEESDDVSQEQSEDEDDWEEYAKDLPAYNQKFTNTNITELEPHNAPFQPIQGSAENPKPSQDEVNDVAVPAGCLGRQIGIATIRMELLSLTRLSRVSNSDSESDEDYQDEIRPEEGINMGIQPKTTILNQDMISRVVMADTTFWSLEDVKMMCQTHLQGLNQIGTRDFPAAMAVVAVETAPANEERYPPNLYSALLALIKLMSRSRIASKGGPEIRRAAVMGYTD
ncbi:hypothetical protein V8F33_007569 [Rhypophila sp. PSN 637]